MTLSVLVVDSDIPFILRLKKALEELSLEVRAVGRPNAALRALEEQDYDVIVIDLMLERTDMPQFVQDIRARQPQAAIVYSGRYEDDPETSVSLGGQGYIHKPYTARKLFPIIEKAHERAQSEPPDAAPADYTPQRDDDTGSFDHLLESAIAQSASSEEELKLDDNTTIQQVISALQDIRNEEAAVQPPVEAKSPTVATPTTEPEEVPSPASSTLRIINSEEALDALLAKIDAWVEKTGRPRIRPLPSWEESLSPEDSQQLTSLMETIPPPDEDSTTQSNVPITDLAPEPVTQDEEDIPRPSHSFSEVDTDLLDVLAEADDLEDTGLQRALSRAASQPGLDFDEELIPTSVEEITRTMSAVSPEEVDEASEVDEPVEPAAEVDRVEESEKPTTKAPSQPAPETPPAESATERKGMVAHLALQLTQFSTESTAQGAFVMQDRRIIARTHELPDHVWQDLLDTVLLAWDREGLPQTRVVYEDMPAIGKTLIYSNRTVDDLILTLIFAADTPMRIIRRQAMRLGEALLSVAEKEEAPPTETPEAAGDVAEIKEEATPEAAETLDSRPTDLTPPPGLKEAIEDIKPARKAGTYQGYGCLLVLQYKVEAGQIESWIRETAIQNEWDMIESDIHQSWINLHIEVPVDKLITEVIETLQQNSNQRFYESIEQSSEEHPFIWANAYNFQSDGRLLAQEEIDEFLRFYQQQAIRHP